MSTARNKDRIAGLRTADLDLAFLRQGALRALPSGEGDQQDEFGFTRLWTEPVLVVLPQRHPLAALPAIPLAALAEMPVLLSTRGQNPDLFDAFLEIWRNAGLSPVIGPPFHSAEDALGNVAASADLWFPLHAHHNALVEGGQAPGVAVRPFADVDIHAETVLAWNAANPNPAALRLVEAAEQLRDQGVFDSEHPARSDPVPR